MRYLNTLYVQNHQARVQFRSGALLVSSPEGKQKIPLEGVDALVLMGNAQITTQTLDACVQRGVRVVALKKSGSVRFTVNGMTGGNVHLRSAQYGAVMDEMKSLELAKIIVAAKLANSGVVVGRWSRDERDEVASGQLAERSEMIRSRIPKLSETTNSDQVRGLEGDAARIYFGVVAEILSSGPLRFSTRTRRPPRDPVNAMLGFCYGLLVTECIGALESVGLDYQMGFFHRPRAGRPSLALDLAEEFRAMTDRFVVALVRRRQVKREQFTETPGGGVYLTEDGRRELLSLWEEQKNKEIQHKLLGKSVGRWALPSVQATLLARYLRGDLLAYPAFVLLS